ncbi:DNA ligase 1 [Salpingoeca rosetta]|uniref:DNA ligase n=1 Tax=Salpingoeca rosetta (strain ATCC 50818 / BSB-021) TaxID=946362 RepID=F2U7M8_SALR5|nr:DNA ligase 1 [Salpingoeca rosetta]EGD83445.1 DNA ligase 1 [Salpingoeca rosetta]|eukprot:XP_004994949.1 DNA ligase 1 [Salpingoeca rosetta]
MMDEETAATATMKRRVVKKMVVDDDDDDDDEGEEEEEELDVKGVQAVKEQQQQQHNNNQKHSLTAARKRIIESDDEDEDEDEDKTDSDVESYAAFLFPGDSSDSKSQGGSDKGQKSKQTKLQLGKLLQPPPRTAPASKAEPAPQQVTPDNKASAPASPSNQEQDCEQEQQQQKQPSGAEDDATPSKEPLPATPKEATKASASKHKNSDSTATDDGDLSHVQNYVNPKDWEAPKSTKPKDPNYKPAWMRGTRRSAKRSAKPKSKAKKTAKTSKAKSASRSTSTSSPEESQTSTATPEATQDMDTQPESCGDQEKAEAATSTRAAGSDDAGTRNCTDADTITARGDSNIDDDSDNNSDNSASGESMDTAEDTAAAEGNGAVTPEVEDRSDRSRDVQTPARPLDASNEKKKEQVNESTEAKAEGVQQRSDGAEKQKQTQKEKDEKKKEGKDQGSALAGGDKTEKPAAAASSSKRTIMDMFFAPRKAVKKSATKTGKASEVDKPKAPPATSPAAVSSTPTRRSADTNAAAAKTGTTTPANPPSSSSSTTPGCDPSDFDPSAARYDPIASACWCRGQQVPYKALAATFKLVEATSKRLEIINTVCNLFRSVMVLSPASLVHCIYLCTNDLAPAYEGIELGIGDSILMKAIQIASGRSLQQIRADMATIGDLGEVAAKSQSKQRKLTFGRKKKPLTVDAVFAKLKAIAVLKGQNSQQRKVDMIQGLLVACQSSDEAKFLIRALGGKLRIGLAELSVLSALGQAIALTPPAQGEYPPPILDASKGVHADKFKATMEECTLKLKTVYCELPNYDYIIPILLEEGIDALSEKCGITPGIPMKPMLAHPTKGVDEVLQRFDGKTFVCEYKYDGERAQVHRNEKGEMFIYSRNSENHTTKYPDVIANVPNAFAEGVSDFVLDCEAVAFDMTSQQILPFQVLSTRKRKDATEDSVEVQVCLFAFDLLYLNGQSLVREPLHTRRSLLRSNFKHVQGRFQFADCLVTSDTDEIGMFLEQSIKDSCEGLMIKTLTEDASYEIARRSHSWLKLKKDYLEGVGDTLDLVVIGGWLGKGKRTGTYGAFLLACYDEESEEYQSICKIGTGFSDEDLKTHFEQLKPHVIPSPRNYYRYDSTLAPDHWFDAAQVWEVKAADLSISPRHKAAAGLVDAEKGISLRFPRFIRVRDDKKPDMATSAYQVADMYNSQDLVQNSRGRPNGPPR